MFKKWFRQYSTSRVVNVNTNIILATTLAAICTSLIIHLLRHTTKSIPAIVLKTFVIDLILDFCIYVVLHYFSNRQCKQAILLTKDLACVQFQRIILSPIYYVVAIGVQILLLWAGFARGRTVIISYLTALFVTRVVHTTWGLKNGLFDPLPKK